MTPARLCRGRGCASLRARDWRDARPMTIFSAGAPPASLEAVGRRKLA